MQKFQVKFLLIAFVLSIAGYFAGHHLASSDYGPFDGELQGVWKGSGTFHYQGQTIESRAVLIIDGSHSRISVTNYFDNASYTIDATLSPHSKLHENAYFDLNNRVTNGLEEFIEVTGISIPPTPGLLSIQAWHLEKDAIFIDIKGLRDVILSYKITKQHHLD